MTLYLGTEAKPAQTDNWDNMKYVVSNMEKEPFRNTKLQQTLGKFVTLLVATPTAERLDLIKLILKWKETSRFQKPSR